MAYRLSRKAEEDIEHIYETSVRGFGQQQADAYYDGLATALDFLADHPLATRERSELTPPSRAHRYRSHLIFYRLDGKDIFVQRIRHVREDWLQ